MPVEVELVDVTGSVEIAPRLGLADGIVDLVSSGNTLRTNGLRSLGTLFSSQAVLIGQPGADIEPARLDDARSRRGARAPLPDAEHARGAARRGLRDHRLALAERAAARRAGHGRRARARARRRTSGGCCRELEAAGASSILVVPVERMTPMTHRRRDQARRATRPCARWARRARRRRAGARRRRAGAAAARGAARARRSRAPLARGAAAGRRLARGRAGRRCSSGAGCRSRRSGSTCRATSSRRSSCAPCRRRPPASSSIVVCTPPAGRGARRRRRRGARDRRGLGARRPAGDRLARLRAQGRQDRRARERRT